MMKRRWFWVSSVGLVCASAGLLALYSCGSSSKSTAPPGGGGGGAELNSGNITAGTGVFSHTFATAGSFPYHCTIHSAMTGNNVTVSAAADSMIITVHIQNASSTGFNPKNVTVKPGGQVFWYNND